LIINNLLSFLSLFDHKRESYKPLQFNQLESRTIMNRNHYKAPFTLNQSQQMRQARKIRYAQGMLFLKGIHHEIRNKRAQMLQAEEFINSIAQ